jgi:uncharacterized protein (DUF4213/DUF364 family)
MDIYHLLRGLVFKRGVTMTDIKNIVLEETIMQLKQGLGDKMDSITVVRAVFGLFFSGVKLSTGHGGLCFTPVKDMPAAVCCPSSAKAMPLSGKLKGRAISEYIKDVRSDNPLKKTLGIAALNALSTYYWELYPPKEYEILMGEDAFDQVDVHQYKKAVVIGALVPMLKKLKKADIDYTVLEMDSRTLKGEELEHFAPAKDAPLYIKDADLLVITGVTILNNTLPDLLQLAKPEAHVVVTGPTASMLPDAFFKRGVTLLGGIVVTKPDELLDLISEGGSGYHFFGKLAERTIVKRVIR